jgi:hypothetical protein
MELQPLPETTPTVVEQPLMQRIGDAALRAANLAQVKVVSAYDHLKREGGKMVAHAALAGLAIAGGAGLTAYESTPAEAAATHIESGGPNSKPGVDISYGWNIYVNYNRAATQQIEHFQEVDGGVGLLAGLACGLIPSVPLKLACAATVGIDGLEFSWAVRNAQQSNECLQEKIPYEVLAGYPSPRLFQNDFGWTPCKG